VAPTARGDDPAAAGSVKGVLSAKGGRSPARTVVYLEPAAGAPTATASPGAAPAPLRISQKDATFRPDFVVVAAGDTVQFVNDEAADIDHNVYSFSKGNRFDLGIAGRGAVKEVRFEAPGRVTVYCSLHKFMEMTVLVLPSRLFAHPDASGAFEIGGVPPGRYVLRTSQASPRWKEAALEVTVEAGRAVEAKVELSR
jgi:plastocyanin